MLWTTCIAALALLGNRFALAAPSPPPAYSSNPPYSPNFMPTSANSKPFKNVTIFEPPTSWASRSGSYARSVLLNQDCESGVPTMLATAAYSPPEGPYFQIFQSKDEGHTWKQISKAYFSHGHFQGGIILQPFLYELAQPFGSYPAGTILLTGNAIPDDFSSTNIQLYASCDKGHTWEYVSTVATGGAPNTTNGATPVWEPFILAYDNQLAVYYSDQRDPLHGQKLAHQTSSDMVSWGAVVNDVAYANYTLRPGMITMAQIGNGMWMCSFEVAFAQEDPINSPYATHYKIAKSPFEFGPEEPIPLQTDAGYFSSAGPYTVWTPAGGPNGTIVVSDSTFPQLYLNTANGEPGSWQNVSSGHGVGYTRDLRVMPGNGGKTVMVVNGGMYNSTVTEISAGDFIVPGPAGTGPGVYGFPACNHNSGGYGHGKGWGKP